MAENALIYPRSNIYITDRRPICRVCGKHFDEEDGIDEMCQDCFDESFTFDMGKKYVSYHVTDFFQWRYDVVYQENDSRKDIDEIFFRDYFLGHNFKPRDLRRYDEDCLKDYCKEVDKEEWARFVLKEREL
ncbi:MAG: hypothetical protein DBY45_10150 [Clostridiales bacterium]|nr:MAG: hypothetical protein DBY45_10150 [Clostridiales bacterium]